MKPTFCENCGSRLTEGSRFCENCGHRIEDDLPKAPAGTEGTVGAHHPQMALFQSQRWRSLWQGEASTHGEEKLGLLILNHPSWYGESTLFSSLCKYIEHRRDGGIRYYVADLSHEQWRGQYSALDLLKAVCREAQPKYCLLLGDDTAVPAVRWDNPSYCEGGDPDRYVDSDLAYVTLDDHEPQGGQAWNRFDFSNAIRVGRIPCTAEDGFLGALRYFQRTCTYAGEHDKPTAFALSAQQWEGATRIGAQKLTKQVFLSPPVKASDFSKMQTTDGVMYEAYINANMLLFNLHGAREGMYWFGQQANNYPIAFEPNSLPASWEYVIGVEACYGAKPNHKESTLCTALRNGCLAFLGSRHIAYGSINESISCADVVISRFLEEIGAGCTSGDAYMAALSSLTAVSNPDDVTLKTLAEFALYGDPSIRPFGTEEADGPYERTVPPNRQRSLAVPMPDVRRAVHIQLAKVSAQVEAKVHDFVTKQYREFEHSTPHMYRVCGTELYQAVYAKQAGSMDQLMKVYFDAFGAVKRVYHSK